MDLFDVFGKLAIGVVEISIIVGIAFLLHKFLVSRIATQPGNHYRVQWLTLAIALVALIIVLAVLPYDQELRGQLLSLAGLLISGVIALSSTTFVGNVLAGAMLRSIKNCRPGDYVEIAEYSGRISEMDLLHCEIQTEESNLVTLPNLYMVTNPMTVLRGSATLVTATLSLGYDVSRKDIETQLIKAAETTGLESPFVQIRELGDYSVTYRVSGLLSDTKKLLSKRAELLAMVLDKLHEAEIEIVSPTFMNQRQYPLEARFVPTAAIIKHPKQATSAPDDVAFDKAAKAETLDAQRARLEQLKGDVTAKVMDIKAAQTDEIRKELEHDLDQIKAKEQQLQQVIQARVADLDEKD